MRKDLLEGFEKYLMEEEKSDNTIGKYLRDVSAFFDYAGERDVSHELVVAWKRHLTEAGYRPKSINSMLASVNSYLGHIGRADMRAKSIRIQKNIYRNEKDELTKEEYFRMLEAAEDQPRLQLIMMTLCSTGARVSELESFTFEAVKRGEIRISCKNKVREILIPDRLRELILQYCRVRRIAEGPVFKTRGNIVVNRSNVWAGMKELSVKAGVDPAKAYPHNLRKLFAREFYDLDKDIAKLADILGHSNIETTRIYIMGTGKEHKKQIEKMSLTR